MTGGAPAPILWRRLDRPGHNTATLNINEADLPGGDPFRTTLRVQPEGWVLDYGGLWQAL